MIWGYHGTRKHPYLSAKVRSAWCPKIAVGWPHLAYRSFGKNSSVCWSKQLVDKPNDLGLRLFGVCWCVKRAISWKQLMLFGGNFWHRIPRSTGPETIPSLKQKYWTQRWFLVRRMLRPFLINWFEGFKRLSCTPFFDIWEFPVHITKGFLEEKGCEAWRNSYRLETIDYFA